MMYEYCSKKLLTHSGSRIRPSVLDRVLRRVPARVKGLPDLNHCFLAIQKDGL